MVMVCFSSFQFHFSLLKYFHDWNSIVICDKQFYSVRWLPQMHITSAVSPVEKKALNMHININLRPCHKATVLEKQNQQSSSACHPIASLHSVLPSIWFLSERKSSFLSSCLCSIISLVPENVPQQCSMRHVRSESCFCCFQVAKPGHALMCQKGVTDSSALSEGNSCRGALMSIWMFLCTINYRRAIMHQGLVSNCQFQVLIKRASISKP